MREPDRQRPLVTEVAAERQNLDAVDRGEVPATEISGVQSSSARRKIQARFICHLYRSSRVSASSFPYQDSSDRSRTAGT